MKIGPGFPGLNTEVDPEVHNSAVESSSADRSKGDLRGLCGSSTVATDGTGNIRSLTWHKKMGGGATRLAVSGTTLYADGVAVTDTAHAAFNFAGTGHVPNFSQDFATFFTEGVSSNAPAMYDERDGHARRLTLPAAPVITSAAVVALTANVIHALAKSSLTGTEATNIGGDASFTVVGTWDSHGWMNNDFGTYVPRVNSGASKAVGDGFYTTFTAADWSNASEVTFQVVSTGEDRTGTFLGFAFGESTWNENIIPFAIESADTINTITIDISNVPTASRNAVTKAGFIVVNAESDFVVSFKELKFQAGTTGERDYVATVRLTDANGLVLRSLESAKVNTDGGTTGSKITLTLTSNVPAGHVGEIWRRDVGMGSYHYVGSIAAGAATYDDVTLDVSTNEVLREGRCAVPTQATAIALHADRLTLYKDGYLWLSCANRYGDWYDATPEELFDLGNVIGDSDGIRIPVDGNVRGIVPFGVTTSDAYALGTLVMSETDDYLLTGLTPMTFSLGFSRPGGLAGPKAWCKDKGGRVIKMDPEGDIVGVWAQQGRFQQTVLSGEIQTDLREEANKSDVVLAYDPYHDKVFVFASKVYVYDLGSRTWDTVEWTGTVLSGATAPGANGGYAAVGLAAGVVKRVVDPDEDELDATYRTYRFRAPGVSTLHAVGLLTEHTGPVTATVRGYKVDSAGVLQTTVSGPHTVRSGVSRPLSVWGDSVDVEFDVPGGSALKTAILTMAPRRK